MKKPLMIVVLSILAISNVQASSAALEEPVSNERGASTTLWQPVEDEKTAHEVFRVFPRLQAPFMQQAFDELPYLLPHPFSRPPNDECFVKIYHGDYGHHEGSADVRLLYRVKFATLGSVAALKETMRNQGIPDDIRDIVLGYNFNEMKAWWNIHKRSPDEKEPGFSLSKYYRYGGDLAVKPALTPHEARLAEEARSRVVMVAIKVFSHEPMVADVFKNYEGIPGMLA